MLNLGFNVLDDPVLQGYWRDGQRIELIRLRISGDEIEDLRDIAGDYLVSGEIGQIRINSSGIGMIISGADREPVFRLRAE